MNANAVITVECGQSALVDVWTVGEVTRAYNFSTSEHYVDAEGISSFGGELREAVRLGRLNDLVARAEKAYAAGEALESLD